MYPLPRNTHYKAAIGKRNEWLVDNADLLISFVKNNAGGAYETLRYAEKKGIAIINIASGIILLHIVLFLIIPLKNENNEYKPSVKHI